MSSILAPFYLFSKIYGVYDSYEAMGWARRAGVLCYVYRFKKYVQGRWRWIDVFFMADNWNAVIQANYSSFRTVKIKKGTNHFYLNWNVTLK